MANEAIIVELLGNPKGEAISINVANGATIKKGTILQLSGDRTGTASDGANVFLGIAAADKEINDDSTTLSVWTRGIFKLTSASGNITRGAKVALSGANLIKAAAAGDLLDGKAFGKALNTSTTPDVLIGFE